MKSTFIAVLLLVFASFAAAQAKPEAVNNAVVNTVRQMEQTQAKNLIGAAEEMPAEKYSYRPTPAQITFAHLVMHSAEANYRLCAAVGGEHPAEVKLSESDSKEVLTKALRESFSACEQALGKVDDSALAQPVALPGGTTTTRAAALIRLAVGWADHYSAAAMYLRLNDLLPPSAKHGKD